MGVTPPEDEQPGIDWDGLEAELGSEVLKVIIPITRRSLNEYLFCRREDEADEDENITDEWMRRFDYLETFTDQVMDLIASKYENHLAETSDSPN